MNMERSFRGENLNVTRRRLLKCAVGGAALAPLVSADRSFLAKVFGGDLQVALLADAIAAIEPYFTSSEKFQDVSRGNPLPHSLPEEKKHEVGLTRETWKLDVISDPDNPASLKKPMSKAEGTALDFAGLLEIAKTTSVRFAKVMTCLNIGCPLGMGIWEGVPLREIVWRVGPRENLRRVCYHGYHNDDPAQLFRSSLPIDRVLEDPFDLPPVILCYKLNGQWLDSVRGGPVRVVVPEAYGFKSIKWVQQIALSNLFHANDTYADGNNDVDSALKSFAAVLSLPEKVSPGQPFAVTGYAQVGISGVSKVQVSILPEDYESPEGDLYFEKAPWIDAEILPLATNAWDGFPDGKPLADTTGFSENGEPQSWPMRLGKVYWAVLCPGLPEGEYTLRSRTIDSKGYGQPMPRPLRKSGHAALEERSLVVVQ
jgi:DMSO/TMAO reductase YedYZ molybdopterin-dependent catalytic subunit